LGAASYQTAGTWTAAVSHRWQYSDRHFVGSEEQVEREKEGSQVINDVHLVDVSVSYAISKRVTATLAVPFQFATRSQAIRDNRIQNEFGNGTVIDRYQTQADGLSDVRLLGTIWLLDPDEFKKGNISLGLGVLFPTGESDKKDVFKVFATDAAGNYQPRAETRNVDNSIQPGGGVWGIIFDIYGFAELFENFNVFASGTYVSTPETDAGVISGNLNDPNPTIWSAADSYLFRAGFGYTLHPGSVVDGLTFTLGWRMEGTPSEDIIGSSEGRRRPGFAISIEPGIVVTKNEWFASFSAPVALYRNRERNFEGDEGDAAFADFITLFTLGRRF
jgi:hypothetical protein